MGAFLLGAGTPGKRKSLPNARIMIHQPLGGAQGFAVLLSADRVQAFHSLGVFVVVGNSLSLSLSVGGDGGRARGAFFQKLLSSRVVLGGHSLEAR